MVETGNTEVDGIAKEEWKSTSPIFGGESGWALESAISCEC